MRGEAVPAARALELVEGGSLLQRLHPLEAVERVLGLQAGLLLLSQTHLGLDELLLQVQHLLLFLCLSLPLAVRARARHAASAPHAPHTAVTTTTTTITAITTITTISITTTTTTNIPPSVAAAPATTSSLQLQDPSLEHRILLVDRVEGSGQIAQLVDARPPFDGVDGRATTLLALVCAAVLVAAIFVVFCDNGGAGATSVTVAILVIVAININLPA